MPSQSQVMTVKHGGEGRGGGYSWIATEFLLTESKPRRLLAWPRPDYQMGGSSGYAVLQLE